MSVVVLRRCCWGGCLDRVTVASVIGNNSVIDVNCCVEINSLDNISSSAVLFMSVTKPDKISSGA